MPPPIGAAFADELLKISASRKRMTVPQSRKGRRPMRVDTMLRKEKEGTLYKQTKLAGLKEVLRPVTNIESAMLAALLGGGAGVVHGALQPGDLKHRAGKALKHGLIGAGIGGAAGVAPAFLKGAHSLQTKLARDYSEVELNKIARDYAIRIALAAGTEKGDKLAFKLQGSTEVAGIPVAIENRKGSVRKGKNDDGTEWSTKFKVPYGYIKGTKGADGEEIDAYVGPKKDAKKVYVVHQKKEDGSYDEDTVMLGFENKAKAKKAILQHYDDPKYVGNIMTVAMDRFQEMLGEKKKLTKISESKVETALGAAGLLASVPLAAEGAQRLSGRRVAFHGTGEQAARSIREVGLSPSFGADPKGHAARSGMKGWAADAADRVFVSKSPVSASLYAGKKPGGVVRVGMPEEEFLKGFSKDKFGPGAGDFKSKKGVGVAKKHIAAADEGITKTLKRAKPASLLKYLRKHPVHAASGAVMLSALPISAALLHRGLSKEKAAGSMGSEQASLFYSEGHSRTGDRAKAKAKPGDVPSREGDTKGAPKAENRQDHRATIEKGKYQATDAVQQPSEQVYG